MNALEDLNAEIATLTTEIARREADGLDATQAKRTLADCQRLAAYGEDE